MAVTSRLFAFGQKKSWRISEGKMQTVAVFSKAILLASRLLRLLAWIGQDTYAN